MLQNKKLKMIDTHAHLNFNAFKDDLDDVIRRCFTKNVWVINVGTNHETSKRAVEIAEKYEKGIYSAIGLHPIHLRTGLVKIKMDSDEGNFSPKGENFEKERYKKLAKSEKVIAIGEIGLDYYYRPKEEEKFESLKKEQKKLLLEQLELAKELNLPVIFHCRKAHDDLIEILKDFQGKLKGVIHCFTGRWRQAEEYLKMGFYLGFNGIIYKLDLDKIIEKTPIEKILIETDCPFLTPPQVEAERNEPVFVKYIAQDIAKIKGLSYEQIIEATTQNAKNLFKI